ncbi:uncharacterized protein LOC134202986 [Armigeres subalbatus]|uniref:uncharacterized protein LOC134202986 n=1 Tax=Armigeres subalbatus TaxID=124917 RepID=UPI002ED338EB
MLYIESLTIGGFPELDDCTLLFRPGLNLFKQQPKHAVKLLSWFLHYSETLDPQQLRLTLSAESYLEIRIRSDQVQYSFGELRIKKQRNTRNDNLISLRRVPTKPATVQVDGGSTHVSFAVFHQEMEQLGLRFGTEKFPMLNVIGQTELEGRIKPAQNLWEAVHDCVQVDAFRRLQAADQNSKAFCLRKLNSAMMFDLQEKTDELQDRIDSSKLYRRLRLTLDINAGIVAQKEIKAYGAVCRDYERNLMEVVARTEDLEGRKLELEDHLDELASIVPQVRDLVATDLQGECETMESLLAQFEPEERTVGEVEQVYKQIGCIVRISQSLVDNMLGCMDEWLQEGKIVAQLELEMETDENCLHFVIQPTKVRKSLLREMHHSLKYSLENLDKIMKVSAKETELLNLTVLSHRQLLNIRQIDRNRFVQGEDIVKEWSEDFLKLTQTKLLKVFFETEIRQKSAHLRQNIPEGVSLETVQGMASLKYYLNESDDEALKENFIAFGWQHLKFKNSALGAKVAALALPHLCDLLKLAIFRENNPMADVINELPPKNTYHVLALDSFSYPEQRLKVPARVRPLSSLLLDSPVKNVLARLMDGFYYTNVCYETLADGIGSDITLICAHDDDELVISNGLIAGGWTRNAERTLTKLSEAVALQMKIIKLEYEFQNATEIVYKLEDRMAQNWNGIELLREDSFDRYHELYQSYSKICEMPSTLQQLFLWETMLVKQKVRFEQLSKLSKLVETNEFEKRDFYEQRIHNNRKLLEEARLNYDRKKYDKDLIQFKHDIRTLGELLAEAAALHTAAFPLDVHKMLKSFLAEHKEELDSSLQVLASEQTAAMSAFVTRDQLDQIHREMIAPEREMLSYNYLFLELTGFLQDLRRQHPPINFQQSAPKNIDANLQRVYEARQMLNGTQPAYTPDQIEEFKFKIGLCRTDLGLLAERRMFVAANLTLPCINKLTVQKLRLITQMMAELPPYLGEPGRLELNFYYDHTKRHTFEKDGFEIDRIVGLRVHFDDNEPGAVLMLDGDTAMLPHFLFFVSFLCIEGCKLLLLDDAFANVTPEEQRDAVKLLEVMSNRMQIFAVVGSDE